MKIRLVAIALLLVAGVLGMMPAPQAAPAANVDGKVVFAAHCAACHAVTGLGNGPYPPLAGNADVIASDTSGVIATVLNGRTGPIVVKGVTYSGAMPAWHGQLTAPEIAAVLTYIRSAWGNHAAAISEDQIALAVAPVALSGAGLYAQKCATCHQASGAGTAAYPPLAGNPDVIAADPKVMIGVIVNGRSGALAVNGTTYSGMMPAWKGQLSNADIAAVATYIRSAWTNHAAGITESQVANSGSAVASAIGKSIYLKRCTACHAANGQGGGGGTFPALAGNKDVTTADAAGMLATITHGRNIMPSWRGQLSSAEIAAVATYVRSAWGNSAGPVTETQAAAIK